MQVKYQLKENESLKHRLTKELIFNSLKTRKVRSFYDKFGNSIKIKDNIFKMEYPFLNPEIIRDCYNCKHDSCFNKKCYFIPDTKIRFIADIVILTKTGLLFQVIEIITNHELSESKLSFYEDNGIPLIIIHSEELLNYTKLYENLKCDLIILQNNKISKLSNLREDPFITKYFNDYDKSIKLMKKEAEKKK